MGIRRSGLVVAAAASLHLVPSTPASGPVEEQLAAIPDGTRAVLVLAWQGAKGRDESVACLPFERRYPGEADLAGFVGGSYRGLRLDVVATRGATRALLAALEEAGLALAICDESGSCARTVQVECRTAGSRAATFDLSALDRACEGACEDGTRVVRACVESIRPSE